MEELWDLYYKDRRPCGVTVPRKDKNGNSPNIPEGCYHIVVECMVIDMSARKLLVTQRSSDKHHGSYWECTAGSIIAGETSLDGVIREIKEETGLTVKKEQLTLLATHYRDVVIRDTYVCLIPKFTLEDVDLSDKEATTARLITFPDFFAQRFDEKGRGYFVPAQYERLMLVFPNVVSMIEQRTKKHMDMLSEVKKLQKDSAKKRRKKKAVPCEAEPVQMFPEDYNFDELLKQASEGGVGRDKSANV